MITSRCPGCKKEFKISGADFDERMAAGVKNLCPVCAAKPPKVKRDKPQSQADVKTFGKNRKK